jgi:hypothetical protein
MQSAAFLEADALCDTFQRWYVRSDEHLFLISQMSWEQKVIVLQRMEMISNPVYESLGGTDFRGVHGIIK